MHLRYQAAAVVVVLALLLTGCLPSSCQREISRAILPQDSLSRQLAEELPVDTLQLDWRAGGRGDGALAYPRTVRFGPQGRLFVSDVERNVVFVFSPEGELLREVASPSFGHPYLAGFRGDTLVVFNPAQHRFDFVSDDAVVRSVVLAAADTLRENTLQYALATDATLFYKALSEDYGGFIAEVTPGGEWGSRVALPGDYWRYAGQLRAWGDRLISLSGFRPVVHVAPFARLGALDTLRLLGFDSPMLHRTRAYVEGEIRKAPLLTSSADPAGDLLFVLNMRPGWLRIDVFDRDGRLQHRIVEPTPDFNRNYYPVDIAARRTGARKYEVAVVTGEPVPGLWLYRWSEPPDD